MCDGEESCFISIQEEDKRRDKMIRKNGKRGRGMGDMERGRVGEKEWEKSVGKGKMGGKGDREES